MVSSKKNSNFLGNIILLIASMIWGFAFVAQDKIGLYLAPFSTNAIRSFIAFFALALALPLTDKLNKNGRKSYSMEHHLPLNLTKRELLGGIGIGFILFIATNLQQFGLNDANTGAGKAAFLTALYIVFVPVIGVFTKKKANLRVWISVIIALIGAYFLTIAGDESFSFEFPDIVLLLCAVAFSFHIFSIDKLGESVDGVRLSMVQFLTSGIISVPFIFLLGATENGYTFGEAIANCMLSLLYLGLGSSAVAYTLQIIGQQMSKTPAVASLIMSLESVFGVLGGLLIGGERLTTNEWIGCAVIFFAVILVQLPIDKVVGNKGQKQE